MQLTFWTLLLLVISKCTAFDTDHDSFLEDMDAGTRRSHRGSGSRIRTPAIRPPLESESDQLEEDEDIYSLLQSAGARSSSSSGSSRPSHTIPVSVTDSKPSQLKRQRTSPSRLNASRRPVAHPVCPSRTEWKQLYTARDINNTLVEVFQPGISEGSEGKRSQWFYTISCRNQAFITKRQCPDCCIGIDNTRYTSSCQQKQSYVMAYVRRPWQTKFHWSWILVNSSCNCAITSIHEDL